MELDPLLPDNQRRLIDESWLSGAPPPAGRPVVRVLSPHTAARIAAGEIIERPASVVKELVENAIDADAGQIRIDIRRGGLGLIRVSDDGIGISAGEMWLACQRHATSKLPQDDLQRVSTLGFRGEALPSIATVAELGLVSASDDSGVGHRLTVWDGRILADEPAPRPRGTTVTVRRLFERVPARLEAASRAQTELAQITQLVRRLALAAPWVRFALYLDDRLTLRTSGSGGISTTMIELYGTGIAGSLIELSGTEVSGARLSGVMSGPELSRPGRAQVNLIVNHRWVQPRALQAMVESAYRPLLPRGRHPILTLSIETPPETIDINIHPTKLEVRLRDEKAIGAALGTMIRDALGARPVQLREPLSFGRAALDPLPGIREESEGWDDQRLIVTPYLPPLRLIGQVQQRLVLLEGAAGLYLVDQHRAHERILYERLTASRAGQVPEQRALPEPILIELRPAQVARFARRMGDLTALGFGCEEFGGRTFLLRAAPVLPGVLQTLDGGALSHELPVGEPDDLVEALLDLPGEDEMGEDWQERLMVSLACRTAIRRGRSLDQSTMHALVTALGQTHSPAVCPHGSPLLMHLSRSHLERQFDWR